MRPSKDQVFLSVAKSIGQLGTCDRAHVGAVLTRSGRAISWGYNGAPPGAPHCDENYHGWPPGEYDVSVEEVQRIGCRNAVHAEANAIAFAARQGISTEGCTLYVERTPCLSCAQLVIAAGIKRVVCATQYRDLSGQTALEAAWVSVEYVEDDDAA